MSIYLTNSLAALFGCLNCSNYSVLRTWSLLHLLKGGFSCKMDISQINKHGRDLSKDLLVCTVNLEREIIGLTAQIIGQEEHNKE